MKSLELFAGVGGIALAAHWAGIETVGLCEINEYNCKVLRRHWPGVPIWRDVHHVTAESFRFATDLDAVDLIAGGFPCQPFSVAGRQLAEEDPRHLWPQFRRVIAELRPTWVVGENVPNLVNLALDGVWADLEDEGYEVWPVLVPAGAVGTPQRRERILIVAYSRRFHLQRWAERRGVGFAEAERAFEGVQRQWRWDATGDGREAGGAAPVAQRERVLREGRAAFDGEDRGVDVERRGDAPGRGDLLGTGSLGDAAIERMEGRRAAGIEESRRAGAGSGEIDGRPESRLGRAIDGISSRLDAARWPAPRGLGRFQYAFERPRLTKIKQHRNDRLRALGNAVCPQQIYPLLAMIAAIHAEHEAL